MKKIKIIIGILVVLLLLVVVAVLIVGTHLGAIVKTGMENVGPKLTQTTLTVDGVDISLLSGSAGVKNLVVGNPDGYKAVQSISVSNAAVSLVPGSVLSDKIVIHSVEVRAPVITFEGNPLGMNNLKQIMANMEGTSSSTTVANSAPMGTNAAPAQPAPAKAGKKLEVDDFLITGATVHANITGIVNRELTLTLPDIHLTALGTGPDGITGADLTKIVLNEVTQDTMKALINSVSDLSKDAVNAAKGAAIDAANGALQNTGLNATNSVNALKKGLGGFFGK